MEVDNKKPFIPRDKPKSWVIAILSILIGLLIAAPILFVGHKFGITFLKLIGHILFIFSWATGMVSMIIFFIGNLQGKYETVEERVWKDQVW